jgi:hypothetical protein
MGDLHQAEKSVVKITDAGVTKIPMQFGSLLHPK